MRGREVKTSLHLSVTTVKMPQGRDRQGTDSSTSAWEMLSEVATLFAGRYKSILSGDMGVQSYR